MHHRFDVALITIGVLNWMPDIAEFFRHVAQTLKPGGAVVIYETHPFLEMLDPEAADPYRLDSSYFVSDLKSMVFRLTPSRAGSLPHWIS